MAKTYYTLASRDNGTWGVAFGDYSRTVVQDELADMRDNGYARSDLKIVKTADSQPEIDYAIAQLNGNTARHRWTNDGYAFTV